MKGIVLFGHGARNPEWAKPFHAIRDELSARAPQIPVALGFLESMRPTLDEAIDSLAESGVTEVNIVPIFLATGAHIARDLPQLAAAAMDRHPGMTITIAIPAGESAQVVAAMAEYALHPGFTSEFDNAS
jgi:sirohydrochlorin cobaltochelatase